jgi:mannose/fructose/N-acetylgalactosamine-specific phosphotransferase system component IIC
MSLIEILPLALLGALLGLDVVTFPQAMISRPLVAGTVAGTLAGNSESGLLIGATLELIALETLPFGASRYPEWGSAAAVGGAIFASHPSHPPGALSMSVLAAIATAWIGGWTMVKLREVNARWARARRSAIDAGSRDAVVHLQLIGLSGDLLRGALLTAVAYLTLSPIVDACIATWQMDAQTSRAVAVATTASVTAGAAWKLLHGVSLARVLFVGGLAVGLAAMVLT